METSNGMIEPLFEKVEQYSKTSMELYKLKAIDKISDVASSVMTRLIWFLVFGFSIFFISIAGAIFFGQLLHNLFYGFVIMALFYAMVGTILLLARNSIMNGLKNQVVKQFNNKGV